MNTRALLLASLWCAPAHAGMPTVRLTELAAQRLDAISFFAVSILICALGIQQLWNRVSDWPRLSYRRALGFTVLWGLLFHLVLTMISGARELMTPGAWVRDGATYQLAEGAVMPSEEARRADLSALYVILAQDPLEMPTSDYDPRVPAHLWQSLHPTGARYVYLPGRGVDIMDGNSRVLAYEPDVFGERQLVLLTDGSIESLKGLHLERELRYR